MSCETESTRTDQENASSPSSSPGTALVPGCAPSAALAVLEDQPRLLYEYTEGHDLVDALPYLDAFTDDAKEEAKKLVAAEMAEFSARDYLAHLPPPRTPLIDAAFNAANGSKFGGDSEDSSADGATQDRVYGWQMDLCRRRVGEKPFQKLNMSRYTLPTPTGAEERDVGAWKRSLDNAKAQAEHSALRLLNLELASKHAKGYWQRHVEEMQQMEATYKRHLTCLTESLESINKKRKLEQVSGGNALRLLMRSYEDAFERNLNILPAIKQVKEQVEQLATALESVEQQ